MSEIKKKSISSLSKNEIQQPNNYKKRCLSVFAINPKIREKERERAKGTETK